MLVSILETPSIQTLNSEEIDWHDLTTRLAAGDQTAFRPLYETVYEVMYWEIKRLSDCDDATVLDILQNSMIKFLKCIKPLPNAGSVANWSRAVAKSETYDWFRKRGNNITNSNSVEPQARSGRSIELDARLLWLEQQLRQLDPELRHLVSLRYRAGWSFRRIGEFVGISTKAADGKIRRAVQKISEQAKRDFDE